MSPDDDDLEKYEGLYEGLYDDDPDGYDRSGVLGADGQVYSDADPGL